MKHNTVLKQKIFKNILLFEKKEVYMKEIWKPIRNTDEYLISNYGNIKRNGISLKLNAWSLYKTARIKMNGKYRTLYVHRLVAIHFMPNPKNKEIVNHKDGNKLNNRVDNLEWCTRQENERHAWKNGYKEKIRETSKVNIEIARKFINNKIPVIQYDTNGNFIKEWDSASTVMKEIKIDSSGIIKCCKGKLKKVGGYKWKYKKDM